MSFVLHFLSEILTSAFYLPPNSMCRLGNDGEEFFTSYDEVYDSFDAMGLQENLLRGIYAYGMFTNSIKYCVLFSLVYM